MARPGVEVTTRAERPRRGLPTDTGVLFAALTTDTGPAGEAVRVTSFAEFVDVFGSRQPYNAAAVDAIEAAFATGVASAFVSRVVGPAAVEAAVVLDDAGAADALRVEAIGPGAYANGWTVEVAAGPAGDAVTLIVRDGDDELERFDVADAADAARVLSVSRYVRGTVLGDGGALAVTAAAPLAGGADDRAGITDVHRDAALAVFGAELGPGQVIAPERTDATGHLALLAHAEANNRAALLDPPRGSGEAALTALAATLATAPGSTTGFVAGDWLLLAGLGASPAPRAIPPSGVVAGLIARGDVLAGVGDAPAGDAGFAPYVLGIDGARRTDAERTRLNAAGVNVFRTSPAGGVQLYGFRSITSDPAWRLFTWHRLRMSLTARLSAAAEPFLFRSVDGRGLLLAELRAALLGVMAADYSRGDLYGETPEEAFDVDVTGNSDASLELGDVYAIAEARFSPFVERARIELVKAALTSSIA